MNKFAIVIGTAGTPAFVNLQLESNKRYGNFPILIHDDINNETNKKLAKKYKAVYYYPPRTLGPLFGDLHSVYYGLLWANENKYDFLIKRSRRFVPIREWHNELEKIITETGYPTFSSWCDVRGYGFLTCCWCLDVRKWIQTGAIEELKNNIFNWKYHHPETFMHNLAKLVYTRWRDNKTLNYELHNPKPPDKTAYGNWPLVANGNQLINTGDKLWKDFSNEKDYFNIANAWNLDYILDDFIISKKQYLLGKLYNEALKNKDIGNYVPYLRQIAYESNNILELTTANGISTIALLSGQPEQLITCANINKFSSCANKTKLIFKNTIEVTPRETDILFIAIDSVDSSMERALEEHGKLAKKIVIYKRKELYHWNIITNFLKNNSNFKIIRHDEINNSLTTIGKTNV